MQDEARWPGARARQAAHDVTARAVWWAWEGVVRVGAIKPGRPRAARFHTLGEGSTICFPVAALFGEDRMSIGPGTVIGPYSTISAGLPGQPPRPEWADPTLVVGARCVIGRSATITAHRDLRIGDDVWMGNDVFLSDQNHAWDDSDLPIGAQFQEPRPVVVGDGCWLGHGAMVLPGATLGRRVVVAAGAVVTGSVPDCTVVAGVPAQPIRRRVPGRGWVAVPPGSAA